MPVKIIPFADLYKLDYSILRVVPFYQRWSDGNSFSTPDGGRPNSGLLYFIDCEADYRIQGRPPFSVARTELSYVPQGVEYTCRFKNCALTNRRSSDHLINFELFDETGTPFILADSVQIIRPRDSIWYARRFEEILQLFHHSGAPKGQIKALLFGILTDLSLEQRKENLSAGRYAQIAPGVLYLEKHFTEQISVPALADLCHVSETSFRRLFRDCTGLPPLEYATGLRIAKARLLLESGAMSVSETAETVGYADPAYFSRIFRLKTGILPRDVLKRSP
jgi:AraC-like DNA-binding protein